MVAEITPVTDWISPDEKVWALVETNLTPYQVTAGGRKRTPASWQGRQRWRITWVNRGDVLTEFQEISPHPATAPELRIPSLWEHTYAECCGMADDYASGVQAQRDRESVFELQAESSLLTDFLDQVEAKAYTARNRSTFGSLYRKQRDGFPTILQREN